MQRQKTTFSLQDVVFGPRACLADVIFQESMRMIARADRKYIPSGFNSPQTDSTSERWKQALILCPLPQKEAKTGSSSVFNQWLVLLSSFNRIVNDHSFGAMDLYGFFHYLLLTYMFWLWQV